MRDILNRLYNRRTLLSEEAREILKDIASGKFNACQVSSFLSVFKMRAITIDELQGFRDALLELCVHIDLSPYDVIDLCGTGGDHKDTFNISTLAAFVVAGSGISVAKHGNYAVSSICGSSNVLEHLGVEFCNSEESLRRSLERANICFLHAPLFHPAMRHVAPIRRDLGVATFFNLLGPIVNPARPKAQLLGVYSLELLRLYSYLFQGEQVDYVILHSLDGYDEISLTGPFKIAGRGVERVMESGDLGLSDVRAEDIRGGRTIPEAAKIFVNVLEGRGTRAQNDVVIANAAMAIYSCRSNTALETAVAMAREALESKGALKCFKEVLR